MELFVTDLDGTLINKDRQVTKKSEEIINELIKSGMNFTVATARTPATAVEILQNLDLKLPVALMNGVLIYDTKELKYIDIKDINIESTYKILDIFEKYNKNPLVYGIVDNHLWVYHKEFEHAYEYNFYKERADKELKTFVKISNYKESVLKSSIINFVAFDEYEKTVQNALSDLGMNIVSVHHGKQHRDIIEQADVIAIGGGNTFCLLKQLYEHNLIDIIREKVNSGTPYLGWSAGANVAGASIMTTNDMPITYPPSFQATFYNRHRW